MLGWAAICCTSGPNILDKRVDTSPTITHFGLAYAQTMPCFAKTLVTCPWQAKLLWKSYGKPM